MPAMLAFMMTLQGMLVTDFTRQGPRRILPGHGECALLRVGARERQPRDIQGVRKGAKGLRPDNAKVADASERDVGEGAVEDVAQQMAEEADHDGLASAV